MKHSARLVLAFVLLLMPYGCTKETTNISGPEDTPSPDSVTILTNGVVLGGPGRIVCEDTTRTIPADQAAIAEFIVRNPAGDTADSAAVTAGGQVTFSGLAPGVYSVAQIVHLKDGTIGPPKIHNDIVVTEPD